MGESRGRMILALGASGQPWRANRGFESLAGHVSTIGERNHGRITNVNLDDLSSLLPVPDIELPAPHERARLRKRFGVTQSRLAQALNVTRKTIGTWEAGKGEPTGTNRAQYAAVLHAWTETEKGQRQ